jgi:hypothetical protein
MNESSKHRINYFKKTFSVTDIEYMACEFYYDVTKNLYRNLSNEFGKNICGKEKILLEDMLKVRCWKLDVNFSWTENFKKQLLELNEKVMNGFLLAYEEAKTQFNILSKRIKNNDTYLKGFNISINLKPFILEPNEDEYYMEERGEGIYYLLYNILPDTIWSDDFLADEHDLDNMISSKYLNNEENFNINEYFGHKGIFDDSFICWAMYDLLSNCKKILSWYDVLKINEIWTEVKFTHQHFIENIGMGTFWDEGIQSLSDNEAENIRQEYLSRLSKDMSGLPVEIFVDEMNCWEKLGSFRRIKFQGNKKKPDYRNLYSMSIEENPRVLVKDAKIDLTDEELKNVKNYVSKNRKLLTEMAEGKISFMDFIEKLRYIERRSKK